MSTTHNHQGVTMQVWFSTQSNGRKIAYRWSPMNMRAIRMSLDEAELLVATGQAVDIQVHPIKGTK